MKNNKLQADSKQTNNINSVFNDAFKCIGIEPEQEIIDDDEEEDDDDEFGRRADAFRLWEKEEKGR